jgi:sensor domain CHASE-containing protein
MVETIHEVEDESPLYKFLTWLALIIATVALIVAWMAYNRSGEDLEARIQRQIEQSANQVDEATPNVDVDVERQQ